MMRFSIFTGVAAQFTLAAVLVGAEFKIGDHTFTVPDGFTVERVAGPPQVMRPIEGSFDERGRLFVSDSSGFSGKAPEQLERSDHRILRLVDTNGDGHFDASTVFADKMMFPEGVLYYDGAVYVSAPPIIWKLEDLDDDGVADRRTVWFDGKTVTNCANDLHGPYLGPDGWLYWCKGAFAKQTHERPGRKPISDSASHIFRCRPDGTEFDSVMSGGMANPVGITFTAAGDLIFTTTFFTRPRGGERDAVVHAIYGAVYPQENGVLDGLTRTGDLLPALIPMESFVPCGITSYKSSGFGAEFEGNLFTCLFNLRKVQRHVLEPAGASFRTRDIDFLESDNPDFHPTAVLEDADGSLLVLDTGAWYRICCPTSQIAKPEVLGGIYRVRRVGAPPVHDPRGLTLAWAKMKPAQLAELLNDDRPAVRQRASEALRQKGNSSIPMLAQTVKAAKARARLEAVWTLTGLTNEAARAAVRTGLADADSTVRQAAIYSAGIHRDAAAVPELLRALATGSPHLQRVAATSLGQIGDARAVPGLLALASQPHERIMEHALIYALIEIGDAAALQKIVSSKGAGVSPHRLRAALIALDQMDGGGLEAKSVVPLLSSRDAVLKETAAWIISLHRDWGAALTGFFREQLNSRNLKGSEREELRNLLGQFAGDAAVQELIGEQLSQPNAPATTRILLLGAMAKSTLKQVPARWVDELARSLSDQDPAILQQTVAVLNGLPAGKTNPAVFTEKLLAIAGDEQHPAGLRLEALGALPQNLRDVPPALFGFLLARVHPAQPPLERQTAAAVLSRARLSDSQFFQLAEALREVGPMELTRLVEVFRNASSEIVGRKLLESLNTSKATAPLRPASVRPVFAKFPTAVKEQAEKFLISLDMDAAQQKARLDQLEAALSGGDRQRGHLIFNSPRAACSACHAIGYLGGKTGPDLTRIGKVRTDRDLLEAIVFPSSNFVQTYEPMIVRAKDGEEYTGILRQESADLVRLISGAGFEQRFTRAEIAEIRPSTVSTMPEGLDQQLTPQELADLVAFLKSLQ